MLKKDEPHARRLRRQARRRRPRARRTTGTRTSRWTTSTPPIEKAKELGGEAYMGPMDVNEDLRIAVLGDPQRGARSGSCRRRRRSRPRLVAWDELHATDVDAAAALLRRARRLDDGAVHGGLRGVQRGRDGRRRADAGAGRLAGRLLARLLLGRRRRRGRREGDGARRRGDRARPSRWKASAASPSSPIPTAPPFGVHQSAN